MPSPNLYNENCEILEKKIEDTTMEKYVPCLWVDRSTIITISISWKQFMDSMQFQWNTYNILLKSRQNDAQIWKNMNS